MSYPSYYLATEGDACGCGRRLSIAHCTQCGSFRVKAIRDPRNMPPGTIPGETAWMCQKCGFGFPDVSRKQCEAPLVLTKAQRAAADVLRMQEARRQGHPLTHREEIIEKGVGTVTEQHPELPPLSEKDERALRLEWAKLNVMGKMKIGVEDFLLEKRREFAS